MSEYEKFMMWNLTWPEVEKNLKETNDDVIVRVATKWRCPVATNDRELRKRLRSIGIPVIFLRQRSRLDVEGAL